MVFGEYNNTYNMDKVEVMRSFVKGCEALAALTGFLCWQKWRKEFWSAFPFYLLFIVLAEFAGTYLSDHVSHQVNIDFFAFAVRPVTFLFFFWVFYKNDRSVQRKNKIIMPLVCVYFAGLIADYFFFRHEKMWVQSFSFSLGAVLLLVLQIRFFIHLVFNDDVLGYKRSMMFCVSGGLFLYYTGSFPFYALRNTLANNYPALFYTYWVIVMCLSCLMYLIFTFSFVWAKPRS